MSTSTTSSTNSIYLAEDGQLLIKPVEEAYIPTDTQCLVRVEYSGVNLCDLNFLYIGLHSFITGFELAGVVEQAGSTSRFHVGDRVCGLSPVGFPKLSEYGTHQDLAIAESDLLYHVPERLSLERAATVCMAGHTAADALLNGIGVGFSAAGISGLDPNGEAILIWGGASSVGIMAIQIAKAIGFTNILTTASANNHARLKKLGASHCFDYKSPTAVDEIQECQKSFGFRLRMAFDTVCKAGMGVNAATNSSAALIRRALSKDVDEEECYLVATLPIPTDAAFKQCTAYRPAGNRNSFGAPQDPESPARVRTAMTYLLQNTEVGLPVVSTVVGADNAIEAIKRVSRGEMSLEKLVIKHPI
ncbi:hypothetical protein NW768_011773 [Fusarium equiseti]|uniref:Enoyl reductase (ER) domain-containing protein n=1 Tax=Fusarium equiseti TaxID=61235 RepID=A0ABQ8QWD8_FUSEQ|nr:hypothetical protein NW768_011773 [Fusarium equiseti]